MLFETTKVPAGDFGIPDTFREVEVTPEYQICVSETIPDLFTFRRMRYYDGRGSYQETGRYQPISRVIGRKFEVVQSSHARTLPGGLRGMHAEPIWKAVSARCGIGMMAWADIRPESESFGRVVAMHYDYESDMTISPITVIVPEGVANGLMCTDTTTDYFYNITDVYSGSEKRAVRWNDPDLAIPWPMQPTRMSYDDAYKHPYLRDLFPEKFR